MAPRPQQTQETFLCSPALNISPFPSSVALRELESIPGSNFLRTLEIFYSGKQSFLKPSFSYLSFNCFPPTLPSLSHTCHRHTCMHTHTCTHISAHTPTPTKQKLTSLIRHFRFLSCQLSEMLALDVPTHPGSGLCSSASPAGGRGHQAANPERGAWCCASGPLRTETMATLAPPHWAWPLICEMGRG